MTKLRRFVQHGNTFYDYHSGNLIVRYKQFPNAQSSFAEAKRALDQFHIDYPSYHNEREKTNG